MEERIDISRLLTLRKATRAISEYLEQQLNEHLSALTPLFNPRAVLGHRIRGGSKLTGRDVEKTFAEVSELYRSVFRSKPFDLRKDFDSPINILGGMPEISNSSYTYTATSGNDSKELTVTSPLNWVLTYKGFGPERLRELLRRQSEMVGSDLQLFVLHYLVMYTTLKKRPDAMRVLDALRFPVSFQNTDEFGALRLSIISCPVSTFRPPDEVMIESTELSGTSAFEEVIDLEDITRMPDPLNEKLVELVKREGVEPKT